MLSATTSTSHSILPKLANDGSNWIIWKTRMQVFLGAKKLAHLIDKSATPPAEPPTLGDTAKEADIKAHDEKAEKVKEWRQTDTEVQHYIISTIPDSLLVKTMSHTTAKDIWEAICIEHEGKTKTFQMEMIRQIHSKRCSDVDDVRAHFARMLRLREELATTGETITERNFTSILTNSLPPSYGVVLSAAYATATMNGKEPTTQQIIAVIEEEFSRRKISNGGLPGSSTALFTNPQGPSSSKKKKKKKPDRCTNTKCKYRHTHEFKDCRSEGGPQHESNPLLVRNNQNAQGGRNAQKIMRANVAQETEEAIDHAFTTVASFSISDVTTSKNPLERVEIYDSGATCHMSPYIDAFTNFEFIKPKPISAADNRTFEAIGMGSLNIKIPNGDASTSVTLRNVLYAPNIAYTLISLSRADKAGYSTLIEDGQLLLIDRTNDNQVVGRIPNQNGLWSVRSSSKALENGVSLLPGTRTLAAISLMDLHRCLGHISPSSIAQLVNRRILAGVTIRDWNVEFCEICALAKIKRHPFPKSRSHPAQDIGEVVHSDVWGPASVQAIGGESYAVMFIDEKSRYGVVEGIRAKSDTFAEYKAYEAWLRVQRGKVVKHLQSDRGGEYMSNEFAGYLRQQGTTRQLTVHDSSQSNGIAERCNGVLLEHVRAMLADSGLPKYLWKEALKFAMWIRNRTTTHLLDGKTPYEAFYGVKPDIGDIHLWGSRVWVRDLTAGKLDPRGREGKFIGYDAESKGCRIYWTNSRSIGVERDLIFEDRPVTNELILLPEPSTAKDRPPKQTATTPLETLNPPETPSSDPVPDESPSGGPASTDAPSAAEPELPARSSGRIRKPSRYVREALEGTLVRHCSLSPCSPTVHLLCFLQLSSSCST